MIEEEIISQEPVQQPPYKKKVFDILSSNFDDFKLGEQDFYKKLATDKNYAGKVHDVLIQNFSDFKKPKNEFIDSLTFEEPLKKKDGGEISSPTKLQFPSLDTKLFGEAAIKPVSESTNFGNADIVDKTKMMESLPFVKDKAIHDKTIKNLLQQGKLAMEGSNSYKEEKQNVANTLADEEWMPSAIRPAEKDYIKNKAIKDFSAYNKEEAGVIQQKLDNGDYLLENGKIKIRGGIADNFGQGVKDFIDNVGLSLNVAAAQSRGNNNEVKYYMNEFFKDKEKDKEFAAVSLPEKASKVIGEMSPYAIAGAVMPYADIPLMGMSNLASNHQAIWDDPKLTMDEKVNAINNTSQDAFMTGNLQGAAFHSLGITDEKVAKELLSRYQPTQKLYNTFKDVIKTLPSDVSKVAAIGGGTEVLNNLTKNKAGIKVDFSTVPEGALSLATLELIMKAPKVFVSGFKTINEAVRTGYDKENPNWYNGYSKNVQDVLNQIVASPEPVYKKLINLLDVHPDAESNLAKQKIETFRDYYKSLPADLDQTQKNKALHILQLKTEAIADSKNAQDPTIRKALENKSNAYDKILQKVIDKESVKEGEEPLLSSRFAKPILQEEEPVVKVEPAEDVKLTEESQPINDIEKQKELENKVEELKKQRQTLRAEDGSVPADKMDEFNRLGKEITKALEDTKRGNSEQIIFIREYPKGVDPNTSNAEILTGKNKDDAVDIIEQAIKSSKSAKEAYSKINKLGYIFDTSTNQIINRYLNDRFDPNAPKIGNNKDSFQSWVKGESDVKTTEEIPNDLEERGEPIETTLEAERRRSNGERIFAITEQDGTPVEITSVEMLRNYTPDQLLAYKPSEIIKNKELQENKLILQNGTKEQGNGKDTGAANGGEMGGLKPSGEGVEVGLGAPSRYVVGKGNRVVRDVTTVKKISIPDSEAAEIKKVLPNAVFDDSFSEINSAEQFHKAISKSLKGNKHSSSVFVYPIEEYKNSRLFLTNDGKAGVAITKDGDIISVFSYGEGKNRVAQLLVNAIKDGGVSLDHYDTRLTNIYSQFGFVPVARVKFDRAEAPKTWDYELYKDYNKGEPDVIAMAYNGGDPNTLFERVGKFGDVNELLKKTPYVDTWEQAKKLQQEFVNKVKTEVEPSIQKDIKTQIEDFGVPKEDVEPVNTMLSNIYESLKKSGLTAANTLSEWVGIGRGTKEKGALFQPTIYGKSGIIKRPSFDKASADKAIKSGRVKVISPKKSLEDLTFAITHWDDLFVGDIFHNDKKIGSFDGGVFYPLNGGEKGKMGASVNPQSAGAFATQSNRSLFKNNGIKLPESFSEGTFVIEKGSNKNEWILTNKVGEKVTVNLPDNPKPGVVVIGKGDNLKHKSSLSAKVGFVNTLLSYAKGKEGYDGLINAIKSVYSIGNTRNADSVIDLFNNYLKSGRMADGQTMSEAKTSYENFRAALIKDANPVITSMMRDMGYTEAEYFDGTQLKKGIYKATGKGIDKMFADLGQEDFLKGLKTGDAYAALKVTSPVFFEKDLSHPSYPFAIKTIDSSPVNIDIFNKTFRTFGENQGIQGRLPKEGQLVTEGFGVTTTTKPSFKIKQDIDLSHPSSIDLSGALGQYESVQRTQSLKQKANAQYRIESGKNIIEALREFNKAKDKGKAVVAITHEIMHPTVVEIISGAKDGNEIGKKHTQTIVDEFNKATGNKITVDELISGNDEFKGGKTTKQYRDVQEFIAESWEKYHTQGAKGFSAEFQKVLETITEAFKTVYKSLTGKELTPELRRMFDDILGKSEFKSEYEKQLLSEGISKKRQEKVRKTIIDSNFDQIVKDLIRNNKIEKIC